MTKAPQYQRQQGGTCGAIVCIISSAPASTLAPQISISKTNSSASKGGHVEPACAFFLAGQFPQLAPNITATKGAEAELAFVISIVDSHSSRGGGIGSLSERDSASSLPAIHAVLLALT